TKRFSATLSMCSVPLLTTYPTDRTRALSQQPLLAGPTLAAGGLWVAPDLKIAGRVPVQKVATTASTQTRGLNLYWITGWRLGGSTTRLISYVQSSICRQLEMTA